MRDPGTPKIRRSQAAQELHCVVTTMPEAAFVCVAVERMPVGKAAAAIDTFARYTSGHTPGTLAAAAMTLLDCALNITCPCETCAVYLAVLPQIKALFDNALADPGKTGEIGHG